MLLESPAANLAGAITRGVTAVFISVERKEGFFPNYDSTAVLFLLALHLAHMGATLAFD